MNKADVKDVDVLIIGAGPAGLFAAHELMGHGLQIVIVDMGKDITKRKCPMNTKGFCLRCEHCDIMCGVGGSGTFSDGTLNLRPDIGGDLAQLTGSEELAWELVEYVDRVFLKFGAPAGLSKASDEAIEELKRISASVGAKFVDIVQRHIGSDNTPRVIQNFKDELVKGGVRFILNTTVSDLIIRDGRCEGVLIKDGGEIRARCVLLAPGRIGASWINDLVMKHGIRANYAPIDIGVRVEVPAIIMDPITKINRDPKFYIRSDRYDDFTRTFCTNEHGFVVKETYEGFIGVNGHSLKNKRSENTNFAFLVRLRLTEPLENTTKYGRSVSKLATTIGGGKPILQRMGDLRRGRRSTWKSIRENHVKNTLEDVTPGDISMALPHRIVMDIIEGLEKLNEIIPGVAADSTLLYAPEVKFYAMEFEVDSRMETNIEGLFAAGDGAGLSRDIVNAAATGVLAGRGILEKIGSGD
ncbi:MAG TPA: NAD(P)/FAD-dependent oxidoreductase [Candidatus Syntrophoarchaeum butanivorans]|uniref:NAD(P)/FAD-dependent oxidoreductase n=1 Tax=Candidatus Syntropharchaeum butanivorans TaxID=1839936 RepID=A0A7C0X4Q0_9EURY|nr:MAG: NAD(P)/FAD-dependent oxidoreductase [Candidatus Syntrophoarchaeum sp. WYZ-LMO15]HDM36547.1 NAD(P)/FAD-dependent oxidoreductase [Candidatus Syntrophoarchaeum butanivorans]HEC56518.1 NAD(P)/FAD-dependent oxidoreductase [Candidatus Syntrophoarchaeum butanivorans]